MKQQICDAEHQKGDFAEGTCVSFHKHNNDQSVMAMFFDIYFDYVFADENFEYTKSKSFFFFF